MSLEIIVLSIIIIAAIVVVGRSVRGYFCVSKKNSQDSSCNCPLSDYCKKRQNTYGSTRK